MRDELNKKSKGAMTMVVTGKVSEGNFYLSVTKSGLPCLILIARKDGKGLQSLTTKVLAYRKQLKGDKENDSCTGTVSRDPKNPKKVVFFIADKSTLKPKSKTVGAADKLRKSAATHKGSNLSFLSRVRFSQVSNDGKVVEIAGADGDLTEADMISFLMAADLSASDAQAFVRSRIAVSTGLDILDEITIVEDNGISTDSVSSDDGFWDIGDMANLMQEASTLAPEPSHELGGVLYEDNSNQSQDIQDDSPTMDDLEVSMRQISSDLLEDLAATDNTDNALLNPVAPAPNMMQMMANMRQNLAAPTPPTTQEIGTAIENFTLDFAPPNHWERQQGNTHTGPENKHFAKTHQQHMQHLAKLTLLENYSTLIATAAGQQELTNLGLMPNQLENIPLQNNTTTVEQRQNNPYTKAQVFLREVQAKGVSHDPTFTIQRAAMMAKAQRKIMLAMNDDFNPRNSGGLQNDPSKSSFKGIGRIVLAAEDPKDKHYFLMLGMLKIQAREEFSSEIMTYLQRMVALSKEVPVTVAVILAIMAEWTQINSNQEINISSQARSTLQQLETSIRQHQANMDVTNPADIAQMDQILQQAVSALAEATWHMINLISAVFNRLHMKAPKRTNHAHSGNDEKPDKSLKEEQSLLKRMMETAENEDDYYDGLEPTPQNYSFTFTRKEANRLLNTKKVRGKYRPM